MLCVLHSKFKEIPPKINKLIITVIIFDSTISCPIHGIALIRLVIQI